MTFAVALAVRTFPLFHASDVAELRATILSGELNPDQVTAVTGKTEGEGGPYDESRIAIDFAIRALLLESGSRDASAIAAIPMNFSGGSGGVIAPHFTIFIGTPAERDDRPDAPARLVLGRAVGEPIAAEHIGRMGMVDSVAAAVIRAAADAGIDPREARYVMAKNPMLTPELVADAARRGVDTIEPGGLGALYRTSGGTALGAALALGDIPRPTPEQIGIDAALYSARVSASSGTESDAAQVLVFGNQAGAPGDLAVGRAEMTDALDVAALHRACRAAGLDVPDFADPATFSHRVAAIFVKCNPTDDGRLRGYPQVQRGGPTDRAYTTQLKASVGGMFAAALGNPAFYISGAGFHQGAPGGGSVVVIADHGAH